MDYDKLDHLADRLLDACREQTIAIREIRKLCDDLGKL